MLEYCKGLHSDPSYEFFGTTDYGILDIESRKMLMYSEVRNQGEFSELHVFTPFNFEEFNVSNKIKGKNLRGMFVHANKVKGLDAKITCVKVEKEDLMATVMKDLESLPKQIQALVETAIAETF